jgi:hypothetical protein
VEERLLKRRSWCCYFGLMRVMERVMGFVLLNCSTSACIWSWVLLGACFVRFLVCQIRVCRK